MSLWAFETTAIVSALLAAIAGCSLVFGIVGQTKAIVRSGGGAGWGMLLKYGSILAFCAVLYLYPRHGMSNSIFFAVAFFGVLFWYIVARKKSLR